MAKPTQVIGASALGTLFEWYDFFLYGSLAGFIATHFFSGVNETTGFILALAAFAVGFIVRPLGALVFGRIGDMVGRKNTFLVTLTLMGVSTVLVGVLPGYESIGIAAPVILVALRIVQGLAIGGEFGGAIIYVAEHAPAAARGRHVSWIPTTAIWGLLMSMAVIAATRAAMTSEAFGAWGWRIPFLISVLLLGISLWIRLRLQESPMFRQLQQAGALSKAPLAESFLRWENLRQVLVALFGNVAGQAVLFYTSTFYAFYFLERMAMLDGFDASVLFACGLLLGAPFVIGFGWLSDRIGRKPLLVGSLVLGAALYFPLFEALLTAANPALAQARQASPVVVHADPADCSLQFDPLGRNRFDTSGCDVVKAYLARTGVDHETRPLAAPGPARLQVGAQSLVAPDPAGIPDSGRRAAIEAFQAQAQEALAGAGYGGTADPATIDRPRVVAILVALLAIAAMCLGPYGAMLVELFPTRIRYSALSFPQNFGNGWFGGLLPAVAFAIVAATGDIFAGLWYPVAVAAACAIVGLIALPETRGRELG
ncbi:MAG: MFS transporter [Steroidobacteraceae bacterium]